VLNCPAQEPRSSDVVVARRTGPNAARVDVDPRNDSADRLRSRVRTTCPETARANGIEALVDEVRRRSAGRDPLQIPALPPAASASATKRRIGPRPSRPDLVPSERLAGAGPHARSSRDAGVRSVPTRTAVSSLLFRPARPSARPRVSRGRWARWRESAPGAGGREAAPKPPQTPREAQDRRTRASLRWECRRRGRWAR
jgi:hypothetical protein